MVYFDLSLRARFSSVPQVAQHNLGDLECDRVFERGSSLPEEIHVENHDEDPWLGGIGDTCGDRVPHDRCDHILYEVNDEGVIGVERLCVDVRDSAEDGPQRLDAVTRVGQSTRIASSRIRVIRLQGGRKDIRLP